MLDYRTYLKNGRLELPDNLVDYPEALFISENSDVVSLGNIRTVRGELYMSDCENLHDLGDLATVNGPVNCINCPNLAEARNLVSAKGFINMLQTQVTKLPENFALRPLLQAVKPMMLLASPPAPAP